MSDSEKSKMLAKLSKAHGNLKETIKGKNVEVIVYSEANWRIRDILGHIATWNRETVKSIDAFMSGDSYIISDLDDDESDFNESAVMEQRKMSNDELLIDWEKSTTEFLDAIGKVPHEKFSSEMIFPWGDETGSASLMMKYMIEHVDEHRVEIEKVL